MLRRPDGIDGCLARIAACDGEVRAWAEVSPKLPLREGRLDGVAFGAKDIFETSGMATEYGSPLYAGRKGACDAAIVTELRRQGGIVGFKPTFGTVSRDGVLPFAPSLDTVGFFTETAADMLEFMDLGPAGLRRAALAVFPDALIAGTVERLRAGGFTVVAMDPPDGFDLLLQASRLINDYEGARTHDERWREHGDGIGAKLAALVERGLAIPQPRYDEALETVARMRGMMAACFAEYP